MITTQNLQNEQHAEIETRALSFYGNVNSHYLTNYKELVLNEQEENEQQLKQD